MNLIFQTQKIPGYSEVLKKNLPPSQIFRLQKRAAARAEQATVQAEKQRKISEQAQNNAELVNIEIKKAAEQAKKDAEKAQTENTKHKKVTNKAIKDLEEANDKAEQVKAQAEQAKTQLERLKVDYDVQFDRVKAEIKGKYCEKIFQSITVMKNHIKEVHNYPCSVCAYICMTMKQLEYHWSAGDYDCPECEFCDFNAPTYELLFTYIDHKHKNANRYKHPFKPLSPMAMYSK